MIIRDIPMDISKYCFFYVITFIQVFKLLLISKTFVFDKLIKKYIFCSYTKKQKFEQKLFL